MDGFHYACSVNSTGNEGNVDFEFVTSKQERRVLAFPFGRTRDVSVEIFPSLAKINPDLIEFFQSLMRKLENTCVRFRKPAKNNNQSSMETINEIYIIIRFAYHEKPLLIFFPMLDG